MLVPALLYKAQIDEVLTRIMYDDRSLEGSLTPGRVLVSDEPNGATISSQYEWAIIDDDKKLLGRLIYWYHWYDQCLYISGFNNFCGKSNPKIGFEVMRHFQHLRETMNIHRVEWRVVSGNPVQRGYDKICKRYNGTVHVLRDVLRDRKGIYHDERIYEIIFDDHDIVPKWRNTLYAGRV